MTPQQRRCRQSWVALCGGLALLAGLATPNLDRLQQLALSRHGNEVARQVGEWRTMLHAQQGTGELEKLESVNRYLNRRIRWVEDQVLWQQDDYWATLLETFAKGAGDCEDFAIAKYVSLLLAGVQEQKLRLTYVRMQRSPHAEPEAHMILAYYATPTGEPLILDNLDTEIKPASRRADLTPVYAFNASQLWFRGPSPSSSDPTARISRWRDVLARLQAEHTL
ncbi:MAG: transglutaminase-like cysteine peptidase [Hylemonella sp.]|nr:transglutaminase-like cysteine peptidase [Hylemonella sp.]